MQRQRLSLVAVHELEYEIDRLDADEAPALTVADRERLISLGQDLVRAWESPSTTPETRKKIIRTVISEIIVDIVGDKPGAGRALAGRRPYEHDCEAQPRRPDAMDHRY